MFTTAQLQAIKTAINADPALASQPNTPDGAFAIADALNAQAAPAFIVWRTRVPQDEITQNGFAWVEVDSLTVGKARIWEWLFRNSEEAINPSKVNVRDGIIEVWKGTAARLAVQAAVFVHCKRPATRLEKILATGTGTTESPATMGYEGDINYQTVQQARAL
jgi:hypothetical protein